MNTQIWTQDIYDKDIQKALNTLKEIGISNVFCHSEYVQFNEKPGEAPTFFVYKDAEKIFLKSFLLRDIPASDYYDITNAYGFGGYLCNSKDELFIENALKTFTRTATAENVIGEVIKINPYENAIYANQKQYAQTVMREVVSVPLTDSIDQIFKNYTHANRKNIKKAERYGFSHSTDNDEQAWTNFTHLYHLTMDSNKAADFYYFSKTYFQKLAKQIPDNYLLINIKDHNKTVASLLILHDQQHAYCHLLGNDPDYFQYGINNYIYHLAIGECKALGFKHLLLGGGRTNRKDDSLFKYKQNFSNTLMEFMVGEVIFNQEAYKNLCEARGKTPYSTGNLFCYRD